MFRVLDLYSGVGGLSYGFAKVYGSDKVLGIDIGKWQVINYRKNVSHNVIRANLLTFTPEGEFDIIIGGSPCEPFSQLNITDKKYERHPLYPTLPRFYEIVKLKKPIVFIHENVPKAKEYVKKAIKRIKLHRDYYISMAKINYAEFGVGCSRKRLFTVGVRKDYQFNIINDLLELKEPGPTLRQCISKYVNMPMNPKINHVWRESKRNGVFFSFQVGLEWDKPLKGFGNPEKAWVWLPDGSRIISVRELMACMGFPESFILNPLTPLREMYEMIADSVSPYFSLKLAKVVKKYV